MSSPSPNLDLPYLAPQQAQKHVTVNEGLRRLDTLVQLSVVTRTLGQAPAVPAEGAVYIVPAGGGWFDYVPGALAAFRDAEWTQIAPKAGWRAWIGDEARLVVFDGADWSEITRGDAATSLGVNTAADAINRLAVKSDAVLFSHDDVTPGSGDVRVVVNKDSAGGTASHLFQTNFSGRAEFGLTGDENFHLRVAPDGATWTDAIIVDRQTGHVGLGGAPDATFHARDNSASIITTAIVSNDNASSGVQTRFSLLRGGDQGTGINRGSVWFATSALLGFADYEARTITLWTGQSAGASSARLSVAPNGNVGIGLASPTTTAKVKLEVEGPVKVKSYTKAALPEASIGAGQILYVSDEAGGATLAFSDGAAWRRVQDRAVVS